MWLCIISYYKLTKKTICQYKHIFYWCTNGDTENAGVEKWKTREWNMLWLASSGINAHE